MVMDITEIPFNKWLGISRVQDGSGYLLELGDSPQFRNHLGTVHASVQLALAEATSAECLLMTFPELSGKVVAVVRRLEMKYKAPLMGKIRSKAAVPQEETEQFLGQLRSKGRGLIGVGVEVVDDDRTVGLIGRVEWFVQEASPD
jgi:acyl-coenzyme A thioesterase PaaI-like protein